MFIIITTAFLFNQSAKIPQSLQLSGTNDVNYTVYYTPDNFFESERPSQGEDYILSHTEYIELNNSFSAKLNEPAEVFYDYTVKETLLIKHHAGADNNTNPIVFQQNVILNEITGVTKSDRINFNAESETEPGGAYTIDIQKCIEIYRQFIESYLEVLESREYNPDKPAVFSAQLLVEFIYEIELDGVNETITRGVTIPITNEIYRIEFTGAKDFEIVSLEAKARPSKINIILIILWYAANLFGIYYGILKLTSNPNLKRNEVDKILRKYSDEIVIIKNKFNLSGYKIITVASFRELLKLALTANKNIIYHDDKSINSQFYVLVDDCVYFYNV